MNIINTHIFDNLYTSLLTYNTELFSIWTMIFVFAISLFFYLNYPKNINIFLITIGVLLHIPYSLNYHIYWSYGTDKILQCLYQKYDVIMIYICHLIAHFGICYNRIPWTIYSITSTIFACLTYSHTNDIIKSKEFDNSIIGVKYSFLFILHFIPFVILKQYNLLKYMFIASIITLFIYKTKILDILIPTNMCLSNIFMHIGIINIYYIVYLSIIS